LISLIKEIHIDAVLGSSDKTVEKLVSMKDEFETGIIIPFPDATLWKNANDKYWISVIAKQSGIPTPKTALVRGEDEIPDALSITGLPAVMKPRFGWGKRGVFLITDAREAKKCYESSRKISEVIIQEFIPWGGAYGYCAIFGFNSCPYVSFSFERVREYPPDGGPSTYRIAKKVPKVIEYGERLLRAIRWYGIAMVEFRRSSQDNEFYLMEINPRFWGSMALAIGAGIDFPSLLLDLFLGRLSPMPVRWREKTAFRWFLGEIKRLFAMKFNPKEVLKMVNTIDAKDDIFNIRDPFPFLANLLFTPIKLFRGSSI